MFFVRIATLSVWSRGVHSSGLFQCGNLGRADSCVAQSPCLSASVAPLTRPHTQGAQRLCLHVCVLHVSVYIGCATPCLKSTVQPISLLHIKASIIQPPDMTCYYIQTCPPLFLLLWFLQRNPAVALMLYLTCSLLHYSIQQ